MRVLLDTNILLRLVQPTSSGHASAKEAIFKLVTLGIELCLVPQVLYEFWVVATRPVNVNGLGMDTATAELSLIEIIKEYQLLKDERGIFSRWQSLVVNNMVSGKRAHDARLVAAMLRHRLSSILTFNASDFESFPGIQVLTPEAFLAGRLPL